VGESFERSASWSGRARPVGETCEMNTNLMLLSFTMMLRLSFVALCTLFCLLYALLEVARQSHRMSCRMETKTVGLLFWPLAEPLTTLSFRRPDIA